ncbi:MAG: diguanylate cyclase [Spirochaetales bacterium]|uniref:Diguanylate cyclase n=1 Tax=Candidatus Thalassospirochaeta sargassi TaxID=3119039 RepID=A0AAJ1IE14_9SPIO|nr:diguanylate cyclase [Spirochaetales bacterium]
MKKILAGNRQIPAFSYFIIILIFLMASVITITAFYQKTNRDAILNTHLTSAEDQIRIQKRLMLSHFNTIRSELLFLTRLNEVIRFKELENETDRKLMEKEFLEFISSTNRYDQLRYLDKYGKELTRVNYNSGEPAVTAQNNLQNKDCRYYFTESLSLPENQIYISPFDLNMENGEIEQPLKPMIRFSTPVFNSRGELKGVVILNFFGQLLLDDLIEATSSHAGTFSMLNSEGYWFYNDRPEQEWGFMFEDRKKQNMSVLYPSLWKKISTEKSIQIISEETIYTATMIEPMLDEKNISSNRYYILLNTIPFEDIKIDRASLRKNMLKISSVALFINIAAAIFITILIIQRDKYRSALKESALYDQLTGLPNRKLFEERVVQASAQAKRYGYIYSVMFIDLDGFKPVNDKYGHSTGDKLLTQIGVVLQNCIRETDTAGRFGGDEFVILLTQISEKLDCSAVAEKILARLFTEFNIDGHKISIGASIGIASVKPDSKVDFGEVMHVADAAMYEVKKSGKNNYKIITL